jgi:hypothetical protein
VYAVFATGVPDYADVLEVRTGHQTMVRGFLA